MAYEYLPSEVAALIGKENPARQGPVVCSQSLIDHWVEAYEDANPAYTDPEFSEKTVGGIVAPPGMMITTLTLPFYWTPSGENMMSTAAFQSSPACDDLVYFKVKRLMNLPGGIIKKSGAEWYRPIRLGDRLNIADVLVDLSPLIKTRIGFGHFATVETIIRNQKGETVGKTRVISFFYNLDDQPA